MSSNLWRSLLGFVVGAACAGALYLAGFTDPLLGAAAGGMGAIVTKALIFGNDE